MTEPEELERAILGGPAELTGDEVAEAAGLTPKQAERLWRALGFPDAGDERAFGKLDVEALTRVARFLAQGGLDFDTVVRLTRGMGTTMDRLAEWEVAALTAAVEGKAEVSTRRAEALRLVETMGPDFEALLSYAWRRHLAAAVARVESLAAAESEHVETTVGFADLVGFSELTNDLDEDQIGNLVEMFEGRSHDVVSRHRARVVKTLGDSVLFMATTPDEGIDIAWDIIRVIGGDERLPDVRVGVVTGPVVLRMGDVYGPAVNLAARLVAVARRNRVITDAQTAARLSAERFDTRILPARPVRGFGDLEPVAVRRLAAR
jgi:adenylate cyclase